MKNPTSSFQWRLYAADISGVSAATLDDSTWLQLCVRRSLATVGSTMLRWTRHEFQPQGVSLIGLGAGARIAMHTWPELGKATLDVWASDPNVELAIELIAEALGGTPHRRSGPTQVALSGGQ